MNILAELQKRFAVSLGSFTDDPAAYLSMIKPSQDRRFGDFQANCAMSLAKKRQTNPREIAADLVTVLDVADLCEPPEVAGPGFINLRLRDDWLAGAVTGMVTDDRLGVETVSQPRTFVIDYSSPNIAKPMHVGHLRSTVIGDALCRMLRFTGHRVIGDNHVGDWGTQFGMILFGYKHFLDEDAYRSDPVGELARLYRLVNQLTEYHDAVKSLPALAERCRQVETELREAEESADPQNKSAKKALKKLRARLAGMKDEIRALTAKRQQVEADSDLKLLAEEYSEIAVRARNEVARLHAGDEENRRRWEELIPHCLAMLNRIFDRLGIRFDKTLGESFYQSMLADVVADLKQRGLAEISDGAACVFIEGQPAPFIVQKSDGAFTYATTDLATIRYRVQEFDADVMLYVVDVRQSGHFELLFETARRWGFEEVEFRHVSFGTILGQDGRPFKTRTGESVGLEDLLDEAISRARRIVDEVDDNKPNGPELDETTRAEVAQIVGIGAVKYADLHHNRESDYKFEWEKMLSLTGDTATYIQYSVARIHGIFRKGAIDRQALRESAAQIRLTEPEERALALQLLRFGEALDAALAEYRPNLLTQYLFETAGVFTSFYEKCKVLTADDEALRQSRLLLCDLFGRVLTKGLELLGIDTCERM